MKVIIKYFAMIRDMTGHKDDTLNFYKETSIKRMLSELCDMYGEDFKRVVCSEDESLRKKTVAAGFQILKDRFNKETYKTKLENIYDSISMDLINQIKT